MIARYLLISTIASGLTVTQAMIPSLAQDAGMAALKTYCVSDVKRLCPGIEPGGGRLLKCLKANKMELSVGCAKGLQSLKGKMK